MIRIARHTVDGPNGCRDWTGALYQSGYPHMTISGKTHSVTRVVLANKLGRALHPTMLAMHTCDRKVCINPDHLIEGSHAANSADMIAKRRQARGERHWNARLTPEIVAAMRAAYIPQHPSRGQTGLARAFGVSRRAAQAAITGETWGDVHS